MQSTLFVVSTAHLARQGGLCTDGCFYGNGVFRVAPLFEIIQLEEIFRHKVFKMLLKKEKITGELVSGWRHSGFNVFCGSRIQPGSEDAIENLARYIIRASFSQERPPWRAIRAAEELKACSFTGILEI